MFYTDKNYTIQTANTLYANSFFLLNRDLFFTGIYLLFSTFRLIKSHKWLFRTCAETRSN